jgi:hypothetical protein
MFNVRLLRFYACVYVSGNGKHENIKMKFYIRAAREQFAKFSKRQNVSERYMYTCRVLEKI